MDGFAASSDAAADTRMMEKDAHLTNLIIQKREAAKRIEALEAEVATLRAQLQQATSQGLYPSDGGLSPDSAVETTALKNARMTEISTWNAELIHTVEQLQRSLIHLEADSKAQLITLTDRLNQMRQEQERLLRENDALKARVGDDVLRQRQTNRIEMAFERARIAARVRAAGLRRLEAAEANLMEAHDDVYHVQRWDAILLPQRDVSFVFHFVSNVTFPLRGIEEFIMRVYQQFLFHSSSCCGGYRVGFYKGVEVFAFQAPSDALLFSKECHEQLVRLSWSSRIESVPSFSTIIEDNTVLYKGPRIHTCIFSCSPESYVDPVSGKYAFFGPEVAEAVLAAVEQSPIGEIAVNEKWAQLMCMQARMREDGSVPAGGGVAGLRECLGPMWDVVGLPGAHHIIASILPAQLRSRRGVQPPVLHPSRKYPCMELTDTAAAVRMVVKAMKGRLADTCETPGDGDAGKPSGGGGGVIVQQIRRRANFLHEAVAKAPLPASSPHHNAEFSESAAQLLELFSVQEEKKNIIALYRKTESASAALERDMMESEDRFEISKHKRLDPSETAYVCTIDTGDDVIWKRLLLKSISDEQFETIRNSIRAHIHNAAKVHFGFLMNGNYSDVFTYVFREVEQALAFVSEIYIRVNRTGTKYAHTSLGKGRDIFLFRAGVASGPMSSIYRNLENGVLKCTGPAIRLSGTLCDLAESGEILAMEDVIRSFHSKNENLLDTQYNIMKQGYQFIGACDAPAVVHSILPRPFAYRRPQLRGSGRPNTQSDKLYLPYRSALATLMLHRDELPRQGVFDMMEQQLRRLEYGEMARMSAEDEYERSWEIGAAATPLLRNPWPLLCQPQAEEQADNVTARRSLVRFRTTEEVEAELMYARRPTKPLAFLYCDIAGASAIARAVAPPLLRRVWAHYNHIVQSSVRDFSGYVAKTNSATAYLVVFEEPAMALEAARQIQLEMVDATWPEELRLLESTLHVKDVKTSTVLFNGPRPQIAVHVSDQFTWRLVPAAQSPAARKADPARPAAGEKSGSGSGSGSGGGGAAAAAAAAQLSAVHVSGVGVDEAFVLGRHAHGGEIRLSRPLLEATGKHPSGKLLLEQLTMEVVVAPSVVRPAEGAARGTSAASGTSKKAEAKSDPKAVRGNVYAEECVVSVPRQLQGRLALMLPSTSHAFGAAKFTEEALAMATAASAVDDDDAGGGGVPDVEAEATDDAEKPVPVPAASAAAEVSRPTSAALPKAVAVLAATVAQHAWFVEPKGSFNPLPAAWRTDWDGAAQQQPASRLAELGLLEETRRIQAVLQELLKMFPSAHRQMRALEDTSDEAAGEASSEAPATTAGAAAAASNPPSSGGAGGGKKAAGAEARLTNKIPAPPLSSSSGRSSVNAVRRSRDGGPSNAASAAAAARAATRASAVGQYMSFMDFSKFLITVLLNALEIGADQRVPPPLSLPHGGAGGEVVLGGGSGGGGGGGPPSMTAGGARGGGGTAGGAQKFSRGSVSARLHAGTSNAADASPSNNSRESSFASLPTISVPNGRMSAKAGGGASGARASSPLSRDYEQRERSSSDSLPRGAAKVSAERPFQSALDYLDDACRALTQLSGTELGKLATIPAAPPSSKSKAFPSRSTSARRH
ncbi:hypothetical protein NESM_000139700 [Novymonas esmeraldas]|uniref:Guanylate cyclase domain-containing protein n=1 Tax=Novymonas esmeraldas TaxID=1808958 RepID=A0AAW0F3B2_9TRYP